MARVKENNQITRSQIRLNPQEALPGNHREVLRACGVEDTKIQDLTPIPGSYYEKKRLQGKAHNQAIRALGRHLCRIIYKMLKEERQYEIRSTEGDSRVMSC